MNKKLLISQSIMWAAAILVVSIVDEKQFAILMLVIISNSFLNESLEWENEKNNIIIHCFKTLRNY